MNKLFALILFSLPSFLFAQQRKAFSIIGHTTFYNNQHLGIQGVLLSASNKYNDFILVKDKVDTFNKAFKRVQVQHNQFTVNGFLKYPHPFQVSSMDAEGIIHYSYAFFVDAATVNIEINDLSTNKYLGNHLNSKSNKEYQHLQRLYSNSVNILTGEIYNFKDKQKTIHKYIIQNPNSYVALWDLVIDYAFGKLNKTLDDIKSILKNAQLLSSTIKKTNTYKALVESINLDLKLDMGKTFPNIPLNSIDSLIPIIKKNKFTLVDFWFSGCQPCMKQFPSYKTIYDLNKSKGFEIIGISVDEEEADWQKAIQQHDLNWLQYFDSNGIIAKKLNIPGYPTNYLLDSDGKIIEVNITPEDLERFLQQNLH